MTDYMFQQEMSVLYIKSSDEPSVRVLFMIRDILCASTLLKHKRLW